MPGGWTVALDWILSHELAPLIRNETQQEEHEMIDEIAVYHTRRSCVDVLLGERRQIAHRCALMEERRERHGGRPFLLRVCFPLLPTTPLSLVFLLHSAHYTLAPGHIVLFYQNMSSVYVLTDILYAAVALAVPIGKGASLHMDVTCQQASSPASDRERRRSNSLKERQHGAEPQDDGRDHRSRLRLQHLPEQRELQYVASDLCTYMSCCSLARKLTRVLVFA